MNSFIPQLKQKIFTTDDCNTHALKQVYTEDMDTLKELKRLSMSEEGVDIPDIYGQISRYEEIIEWRQKNLRRQQRRIARLKEAFCVYAVECKTLDGLLYKVRRDRRFYRDFNYFSVCIEQMRKMFKKVVLQDREAELERCKELEHFNNNKFNYSILRVDECSPEFSKEICEYFSYSPNHNKKRFNKISFSSCRQFPELPYVEVLRPRNKVLLDKLKSIIFRMWLRRQRAVVQLRFREKILLNSLNNEIAYPQMDIDAQGEGTVTSEKAGNVVLTEARKDEEVLPTAPVYNWSNYTSSDVVGSYNEMTSRWLKVTTFAWSVNDARDKDLVVLDLPLDVIKNDKWTSCQIPNTIPFKVHRYWKGDMILKVQLNSNKFQLGQLQCVWYYQPDLDDKFDVRKCVEISSQNEHVLISAGSSNEVTIRIPYKNHMPMLSTKTRSDIANPLSLGKLFVRVLNPLSVVQTGPQKCNGSIFVKFENCEFTGQIDGNIDEIATPQMDTFAKAALGALNAVTCPNMDNPPIVQAPPYLVPTASHSWSFGTGAVEPLHSLRLDAKGQTQHPDNLPDEHKVQHVASKYGLLTTVEWTAALNSGELLWSCDAAPILNVKSYKKLPQVNNNDLNRYCVPPVGVISSLFNYWRGGFDFRFDIIATQFHTGRLIVGYVPGATESTNVTLETILAGPHMVFTLNESQQFVYSIPYIADRPFWSRRYMGDYQDDSIWAPSRLYVFVLNPLIPMDAVVEKIFINIYQRGSQNFEVSIPVQPCVGLSFNPLVLYDKTELIFSAEGYAPYYPGVFYKAFSSSVLVMRYGTASGAVALFDYKYLLMSGKESEKRAFYYEISNPDLAPTYYQTSSKTYQVCKYAVLWWLDAANKYAIMAPVATEQNARDFSLSYKKSKSLNGLDRFLLKDIETSDNTWSVGNPSWIVKTVQEDDFVVLQSDNVVSSDSNFRSTNAGFTLFGECFNDLKDYMRRYMVYSAFMFIPSDSTQPGQCSYILPILPQGLDLNLGTPGEIVQFANRCRDGPIPLILSGYRYSRGGARLRVILPTTVDCIIWLQHKPDRKIKSLIPIRCRQVNTAEAMANHGYAAYIQDTGVNSIIEVEIPFYLNSAYMLLQRPKLVTTNESFYFGLGEVSIGFVFTRKAINDLKGFLCTVYYSVADDFQASTFQGFPPVVFLDEITNAEPQGLEQEREVAIPQGLLGGFMKSIKSDVEDGVNEIINDKVGSMSKLAVEKLDEIRDAITKAAPTDLVNMSIFRTFLTNVCHILANCNLKSIAIGLCSILCELGILTLNLSSLFISKCVELLQHLSNKSGNEQNPPDVAEEAIAQMKQLTVTEEAATGLITLLWTGMCSLFALKARPPTDVGKLTLLLTKDMKGIFSTANSLFTFLRNIFTVIDSIKTYLYGKINPRDNFLGVLSESYAEVKAWVEEVTYLDDPNIFDKERFTQMYKLRVNAAFVRGTLIYNGLIDVTDVKVTHIINKMYERIKDVRERLLEFGDDCYVRKEPFTLWQCGTAGVGKSTFATHLSIRLLASRNIKPNVPPIYNHEAASDFWDSCNGNPVMMVDDMFAVKSGTPFERHLALLFSVVSPVVLCPPKAKLEDKGKPYNPEILMLNSNYDYVAFNAVDMDAVHRRRNVLFKTELSTVKKAGCKHCINQIPVSQASIEDLADFHHLQFRIAKNVLKNEGWGPAMNYENFMKYIIKEYNDVADRNDRLYQQRIRLVLDMLSVQGGMVDNFEDAYERIRDKQISDYKKMVEDSVYYKLRSSFVGMNDMFKNVCMRMNVNFRIPVMPSFFKDKAKPVILSNGEEVSQDDLLSQKIHELYEAGTSQMSNYIVNFRYPQAFKIFEDAKEDWHYDSTWNVINHMLHTLGSYARMWDMCELSSMYSLVHRYECNNVTFPRFLEFMRWVLEPSRCHVYTLNKFMRHIYREEINYTRYEMFSSTCVCKHLKYAPLECVIKDSNIYYKDVNVDIECDSEYCLWGCVIFKFAWLRMFSVYNPRIGFKNIFATKENMLKIPEVFRVKEVYAMPDDTVWRNALTYARGALDLICFTGRSCMKVFCDLWSRFFVWFEEYAPFFLILAGVVGATSGMYLSYQGLRMGADPNYVWGAHQGNAYGTAPNINLNAKVPTAVPHGEIPQFDEAVKRIIQNMFTITALFDGKILTVSGVVLYDRKLLLLRHYLEEFSALPPSAVFYGRYTGSKSAVFVHSRGMEFKLRDCKTVYYDKIDNNGAYASNLVIMELPICFPQSKDLIRYIATSKQHQICTGDGVLVKNDCVVVENINFVREKTRPLNITPFSNSSHVILQDLYSYKIQKRGMCGSLLLARNLESPIVGIHVAGVEVGNVRGIAELLTQETFKTVPTVTNNYESSVLPTLDDAQYSKIDVETSIYPYGCVDNRYSVHQSSDTQYVKSSVAGTFEIRTEPNPLGKNDPRLPIGCSPLKCGIEHMGKPPKDFEDELLLGAAFDLKRVIVQNVKPVRSSVGVVCLQDAICGNKNIDGFEPLEWSTSPGFPLRFDKDAHSQTGKKWLFDLDLGCDGFVLKGIHPKLRKLLVLDQSLRERGVKPFTVFIDCLKDTCIPIEKCGIPGKTRVFSISPVQFTIQFKQYFLDFMASYQKARLNAEHAIGIDVNSLEWTGLVSHIQKKGDKIICGDYKNYGPGLMLKAAEYAFEIILDWYAFHGDSDNNRIRRVMVYEIIGAYHLCQNLVYSTPCGIPSGSPITTPLNSIVGSLYLRVVWKKITNLSFVDMHEHCSIVTYGDDVCVNVSDDMCEIFNTISMSECFQQYNIVFTDADKSGNLVKWRTLNDAQFLKCSFAAHPYRKDVWLARLDKVSIEGCSNWINRKNNLMEATVQNCEQSVMLAHGWGEEYYNEVVKKLEKSLYVCGKTFRYESWRELDYKRYSMLNIVKDPLIKRE